MSSSIPALVEPAVLRWARETANITPVAASRFLDLRDGTVEEWEAGTAQPTIAQVRKASTLYKRALAVFFLPAPPDGFDTLRDFRRLDPEGPRDWTPGLHAEFRRALVQRENLIELEEDDDASVPDGWQVAGVDSEDPEQSALHIRRHLIALAGSEPPEGADPRPILNWWLEALDRAGVLVLHTSRGQVRVDEARAFCIHRDHVPIIVLNGSDAPRGRLFSLFHEYAHLTLGSDALCDLSNDAASSNAERRVEVLCNQIAASALMPSDQFLALPEVIAHSASGSDWDYETLITIGRRFGTSVEAVLRRLLTLGLASPRQYESLRKRLAETSAEPRKAAGGGNYFASKVRDVGRGYAKRVLDARDRHVIDTYRAATYLDAKVEHLPKLAQFAFRNAGE